MGWYQQYMQQYAAEYQKYMQKGGARNATELTSDDFKQLYSGKWQPLHKNMTQEEALHQYAAGYVPSVKNTSDQKEWYQQYMQQYAAEYQKYMQKGGGGAKNATELTSDDFKQLYSGKWQPLHKNMTQEEALHQYAAGYVPSVKNTSDQKEWAEAFLGSAAADYMTQKKGGQPEEASKCHTE